MAKAFSIMSWNVEHFGATDRYKKKIKKDPAPIVKLISDAGPDIVAIYEVRSDIVFRHLIEAMSDHHFFISEGPQIQEILVGIRKTIPAFTTQKTEFKAGQSTLRPGMLVTPYVDGAYYPLLFLHLKSMPDPKGFGLRADMIVRALSFKNTLKKANNGQDPNFIFLGDLNTMGMQYPGNDKDIEGAREQSELRRAAKRRGMRVLSKSYGNTYWSKKYGESDLDHVVAADHLEFKKFGGKEVYVSGWNDQPTQAKRQAWVKKYSDHALLRLEVQKV